MPVKKNIIGMNFQKMLIPPELRNFAKNVGRNFQQMYNTKNLSKPLQIEGWKVSDV
jgi:hypothetical protein